MSSPRTFALLSLGLSLGGWAACVDDDAAQAAAPTSATAEDLLTASCPVPRVTLTHRPGDAGLALVHKLDLARHPRAVCNDGTAGTFVFRPGFGGGAKRWLIYLEGGGSCGTGDECKTRFADQRGLMSSFGLSDGQVFTPVLEGIKASNAEENPDFYDANLVQIQYCSSDQWSGDVAAVAGAPEREITHWHFRGRAITRAVVEELLGLGLSRAQEVLFTGSSAGGLGVGNQADDLRAQLPASIRLLAMQDAGFGLIYPPYDPLTMKESDDPPFPQELYYSAATAAWRGRGDADCEAALGPSQDRAQCRIPSFTFPAGYITTPMFIRQSQTDGVQTKQLIDPDDRSAAASAYRERFGAQMRSVLAGLSRQFSVFSTHDSKHGVMNTTAGWTNLAIDGTVLRDAVGAWYRDPCRGGGKRIAP